MLITVLAASTPTLPSTSIPPIQIPTPSPVIQPSTQPSQPAVQFDVPNTSTPREVNERPTLTLYAESIAERRLSKSTGDVLSPKPEFSLKVPFIFYFLLTLSSAIERNRIANLPRTKKAKDKRNKAKSSFVWHHPYCHPTHQINGTTRRKPTSQTWHGSLPLPPHFPKTGPKITTQKRRRQGQKTRG
jgi:hypothetical protein